MVVIAIVSKARSKWRIATRNAEARWLDLGDVPKTYDSGVGPTTEKANSVPNDYNVGKFDEETCGGIRAAEVR